MATVLIALYKGPGRWTDWVVRRWQRSPYSHCEIITRVIRRHADEEVAYECWSSSIRDGGVRGKTMPLDPAHWDLFMLRRADPDAVRAWFVAHERDSYDLIGLIGFAWRPWRGSGGRWWCAEACAAALGFPDPFRFDVATFAAVVRRMAEAMPR